MALSAGPGERVFRKTSCCPRGQSNAYGGITYYEFGHGEYTGLNLTAIAPGDAGSYTAQIYSSYGVVMTQPATLAVEAASLTLGLTPKLTIEGLVGRTYTIQYTTNLAEPIQWQTVTNVTLTQPLQVWCDYAADATAPNQPKRYYRVITAP